MRFQEFGDSCLPTLLLWMESRFVSENEENLKELSKFYHFFVPEWEEGLLAGEEGSFLTEELGGSENGIYALCGTAHSWEVVKACFQIPSLHCEKVILESGQTPAGELIFPQLLDYARERCWICASPIC